MGTDGQQAETPFVTDPGLTRAGEGEGIRGGNPVLLDNEVSGREMEEEIVVNQWPRAPDRGEGQGQSQCQKRRQPER